MTGDIGEVSTMVSEVRILSALLVVAAGVKNGSSSQNKSKTLFLAEKFQLSGLMYRFLFRFTFNQSRNDADLIQK